MLWLMTPLRPRRSSDRGRGHISEVIKRADGQFFKYILFTFPALIFVKAKLEFLMELKFMHLYAKRNLSAKWMTWRRRHGYRSWQLYKTSLVIKSRWLWGAHYWIAFGLSQSCVQHECSLLHLHFSHHDKFPENLGAVSHEPNRVSAYTRISWRWKPAIWGDGT